MEGKEKQIIHDLLYDIERLFIDLYGSAQRKCADGISKVVEIRSILYECEHKAV